MRKTILELMCVLLLSAATTLWAQAVNGTLTGRVTTTDGSGIANAAVTITNTTTNVIQKVLTGPDGSFTVSGLPPGTYRVDIETAGFKRTSQQNIELTATGPATVNITLEAGNMNETVEIRGRTPMVQAQGGEVSNSVGMRTLQELPVIDRNPQQLNELQTGVTPPVTAYNPAVDPERNRFFSTNGQSPDINYELYEGFNNLERFRGTNVRVVPEEATQQRDIETANLVPRRGFSGGAVTSGMMRGGTNEWHGSVFDFWSGNILNSRNFFMAPGLSTPRLTYNQPGAAIGGPIQQDHTFFFGSYEGTFHNGGQALLTTVPTPAALRGNFSGIPGVTLYHPFTGTAGGFGRTPFAGNVIPSSLINPTAAAILSYMPAPNLPGLFNNYSAGVPFRSHWQKADARLDEHFNDRTSAFLRYGFSNDFTYQNSPLGPVIGSGQAGHLLADNAALDFAHEFGPSLITDFRAAYNRYDQHLDFLGNQGPLAGALGLANFTNGTLAGINIAGLAPIGAAPYLPENAVDNNYNIVWSWGWHTSHHNVTLGTDDRQYRVSGFTDSNLGSMFGPFGTAYFGPGTTLIPNGMPLGPNSLLYNSLAAFERGAPNQVGISNYLTSPTIRQTEYSFWLGDRMQFWRRFTLDLGARYELYSPIEPWHGGGAEFYNPANNTYSYAGIGGTAMHTGTYDTNNIAPRIGLAFRATGKMVIRGGYAIEYFQPPYNMMPFMPTTYGFVSGIRNTYTTAGLRTPFGLTLTNTATLPSVLTNGTRGNNLPAIVTPGYQDTPYVQTFSLQVQQDFYWGTMLSVGYVGTLGRNLPYWENLNAAMPGAGVAGLPFGAAGQTSPVLYYGNGLTSNYNSLQIALNKRFAKDGLTFAAAYTYSKALGYTAGNGELLNPFNLRSNYGPLDYDRQSVLHLSHLWELPLGHYGNSVAKTLLGGWQLDGIFTWATGTPLTVTANPLLCNCPGSNVFANINGNAILNNGLQYLNPAAFSAPGADQFGNSTRGFLRAPGYRQYDLSLLKHFHYRDRWDFELRGEAYNLTNTPHFLPPVTDVNAPGFGQEYGTTLEGAFGRQINLGLRVRF